MENIKHEFVIFQSMIDVNYRTMCHTLDYLEEHTHTHTHTFEEKLLEPFIRF